MTVRPERLQVSTSRKVDTDKFCGWKLVLEWKDGTENLERFLPTIEDVHYVMDNLYSGWESASITSVYYDERNC